MVKKATKAKRSLLHKRMAKKLILLMSEQQTEEEDE